MDSNRVEQESFVADELEVVRLCTVLRAYVGEYGASHVSILVPSLWRALVADQVGDVKVTFHRSSKIIIKVNWEMVKLSYEATLRDIV